MNISAQYKEIVYRILGRVNKPRYVIMSGGRGSGKTYVINHLLINRLLQNRGETILYARYTLTGVRHGILPALNRIYIDNYSAPIQRTNTSWNYCNSRIIFDGIKSNAKSKLKGIDKMSIFVCDEASDIPTEEEFDAIDNSIRDKSIDNLVVLIFNPTDYSSWIYNRFFKNIEYRSIRINGIEYKYPQIVDNNILHIHTSFISNFGNLSESFINQARDAMLNNAKKFENQYLGIFTGWDGTKILRSKLSDYIDRSLPCLIGVDFGYYPDPTAFIRCYVDVDNKIIYAELICYEYNMSSTYIREVFISNMDYTFICDTNLKYITEDLRADGIDIYYKNMRMEIKQQLNMLSDYTIITSSPKIITEIEGYRMDRGIITASNGDHAIDAIRYASIAIIMSKS